MILYKKIEITKIKILLFPIIEYFNIKEQLLLSDLYFYLLFLYFTSFPESLKSESTY